MKNITFAIIKPDAVKNGSTGKIYDRIISSGFKIKSAKLLRMTEAQAQGEGSLPSNLETTVDIWQKISGQEGRNKKDPAPR